MRYFLVRSAVCLYISFCAIIYLGVCISMQLLSVRQIWLMGLLFLLAARIINAPFWYAKRKKAAVFACYDGFRPCLTAMGVRILRDVLSLISLIPGYICLRFSVAAIKEDFGVLGIIFLLCAATLLLVMQGLVRTQLFCRL